MQNDFETNLERYAELAVKVWLNVQPGQRLLILAPLQTAPLVHLAAKCAYQHGAPFVEVLWSDEELSRIRYRYAPRDSYAQVPDAQYAAFEAALSRGDALLSISAQDPDLLKGLDQDFIASSATSLATRFDDINARIQRNEISWLALGMPIPSWAARVFPDDEPADRIDKLWRAVFQVCRLYEPDPVVAWSKHIAALQARCAFLDGREYEALHYSGPGTDLTVYLPRGHRWTGAGETNQQGNFFSPNIPTEEIFTAPDARCTTGVVTTTKPLAVRGQVIDKFSLTFSEGRVVGIESGAGQELLEKLIATDAGAARLGEVALVPNSSPISRLGVTFFNTLFDENASCHLALGRAYPTSLSGGGEMSSEELAAHGINDSLVHVDFMVGSGELDIDGLTVDGAHEAVMRNGEWSFDL